MVRQRVVRPCDAPCISVGSVLVVITTWSETQVTCLRHLPILWAPSLQWRKGCASKAVKQAALSVRPASL